MDLLVTGGTRPVGSNLVDMAIDAGDDVTATYHSERGEKASIELDKFDEQETRAVLEDVDPDVVVDTAAFHAVDDCETEREHAWNVNATGTRNIAVGADAVDAHYVYLSTDYVFRGDPAKAPYREEDPVAPINYYAHTKYAGEQATKIADQWTILRPSVIYGLESPNFLTWVIGELSEGNTVDIVDDQISTPTYAQDLARSCLSVVSSGVTGIFHATGPESLSRYEFTVTLAEELDFDPALVSPISTEEFGQEAPRPTDSSLNSSALYERLGQKFRAPREVFHELKEGI
jgi:dTDP-4-dehydrorhamnose reductase